MTESHLSVNLLFEKATEIITFFFYFPSQTYMNRSEKWNFFHFFNATQCVYG